MARKIHVINPSDKSYTNQRFVLWFGACAPTYILVYGHLEDCLELAAEWLADNEPGHITTNDEIMELVREVLTDRVLTEGDYLAALEGTHETLSPDDAYEIEEQATADLTYTESGYLASYEWGIALDNPTRTELIEFGGGKPRVMGLRERAPI